MTSTKYKSQPLDFVTYQDGQDGVGIIAVTPQYALTREDDKVTYYFKKLDESTGSWVLLDMSESTTIEEALTNTQKNKDAWWEGVDFETLLNQYWSADNAYPNTLWTCEETKYDNNTTTYSTPIKDTGGRAISQWCLDNDRTVINGAHIGTGTVTAQQIDTGLLNAAGVVISSPDSPTTGLLKPEPEESAETTLDIFETIQRMPAGGTIDVVSKTVENSTTIYTYSLALKNKYSGLRLDLTKLTYNQIYKLKFTFTDRSNTAAAQLKGAVPVTHLGGNIGWRIANFSLLNATIDNVSVSDPSIYDTTGYELKQEPGHEYSIELEFIYLGMNNAGGIDKADNYFYISPNRYLNDPEQPTQTRITVTEISCRPRTAFVPQYILIEQSAFISPTETDSRWQNEFPDWQGQGSVWRRVVTEASGADDKVIYNYGPAQLLTAGESAKIAAAKEGLDVGAWCKKYEVTILDGSNLMTGTIDANEVTVTNLDASNITAGMFTVGVDRPDDGNEILEDSEIIFQAGYDTDEKPLVKIGGFYVDANSIASGNTDDDTGIKLTSGQTGAGKVIEAGTKFNVDANGNMRATGGTIGGFEISPSRLFGSTPITSSTRENVIALYAPILPLEVDFSSDTDVSSTTTSGAFAVQSVASDWTKCVDTSSGKTWGTFSPGSSTVGTSTSIRQTSSWTSLDGAALSRYYPQWKIESIGDDLNGILRDTSGTAQKDENGNTKTVTGEIIENLIPEEDVVARHFYTTGTSLPYVTSAGVGGNTGAIIKKYIELRLYNTSYKGQLQYRFAIELTPSSPWVDAEYTVNELRAPQWAEGTTATFTVTGGGIYATKTWTKTVPYTQIPGGARTDSFTIYLYKPASQGITEVSSAGFKINEDDSSVNTVQLGYKGSGNGYNYHIVSLGYNNWSKQFTLTETIDYIVNGGDPAPVKVKLTTEKYQDAAGTKCALIAGAKAKWNASEQRWKVEENTETLRIEHDGTLRLKDGLEFYEQGIEYTGTWGQTSEKSWAAAHNAGSTTYKWWNTDTGGNPDRWKSFAQVGVNKTYKDNVGLTESATDAAQSPATLFLAASTNAFHTNLEHPLGKRYKSSAIIRAAATPMYDSNCTAEITLSRYNIDLVENTTADVAARTIITPDNITTGSVQTAAATEVTSDRNLKNSIEPLSQNYSDLFDKLTPVSYKYNNGTSDRLHTGFIAQDVEQAILDSGLSTQEFAGYTKEADRTLEDGTIKEGQRYLRYDEFVALNTDQIQKLKKRVAELESTVEKLTSLLETKTETE